MFFFNIVLTLPGPLRFHMNLRMGFSVPEKHAIRISTRAAGDLQPAEGHVATAAASRLRTTAMGCVFIY